TVDASKFSWRCVGSHSRPRGLISIAADSVFITASSRSSDWRCRYLPVSKYSVREKPASTTPSIARTKTDNRVVSVKRSPEFFPEAIAAIAKRVDQSRSVHLEFFAQLHDVHFKRVRQTVVAVVPHFFVEARARENLARMPHHEHEQRLFPCRQI